MRAAQLFNDYKQGDLLRATSVKVLYDSYKQPSTAISVFIFVNRFQYV